jgi:hypothetical protein
MKTFYYDLFDDGGVNSLELPIKLHIGAVFTCEYGTYEVREKHCHSPVTYTNIVCERISKETL